MTVLDLSFAIIGERLQVDHAYGLYSALCRQLPLLHEHQAIGILSVNGTLVGNRELAITKKSRLVIRTDHNLLPQLLALSGKRLELDGHMLRLGLPEPKLLRPSARLYSRLVTLSGYTEPATFMESIKEHIKRLEIDGKPSLIQQKHIPIENKDRGEGSRSEILRRTIRIKGKEIVGFALRVEELTAEESIRLQEFGLGGRRRFGCGIFIPAK